MIVVFSILALLPLDLNGRMIKYVMMIRLLRPLRVIAKSENLRISINALLVSVPAFASLYVIVVFVIFIFAIVGVNLLKGKNFYCDTDEVIGLSEKQIETLIRNSQDCVNYGGLWRRRFFHFDTFESSLKNFFIMSQTINWADIMYDTMNGVDPELMPGYKVAPALGLFFMTFIMFGGFFICNLFIGVVIAAFNAEMERQGKDFLLSDLEGIGPLPP